VVEAKLTGNEIESFGLKRQYRAICLNPNYILCFALRLMQHSERSVKPRIRSNRTIRHKLASGAAGNIQERQTI